MGKLKTDQIVRNAAHAHSDLNTFHAVAVLMEGGLFYEIASRAAAEKILAICKREADRCLRSYDASRAALSQREGE